MAWLLDGCLFILQMQHWYWTWKAFLSIKNYFYQHQNITFIAKGFPSAYWLSYLKKKIASSKQRRKKFLPSKTNSAHKHQLTVFMGGVCLRSRKFFQRALFSRNNFFARRRHFKELQDKGNLFSFPQILIVASLTYKKIIKIVWEFFISKYLFSKGDFCTITPSFFNLISKMFCNFSLKLNMANRRHVLLALWARKVRDIK